MILEPLKHFGDVVSQTSLKTVILSSSPIFNNTTYMMSRIYALLVVLIFNSHVEIISHIICLAQIAIG